MSESEIWGWVECICRTCHYVVEMLFLKDSQFNYNKYIKKKDDVENIATNKEQCKSTPRNNNYKHLNHIEPIYLGKKHSNFSKINIYFSHNSAPFNIIISILYTFHGK